MLRTFCGHETRRVVSLNGTWDFTTAEERRNTRGLPERYSRRIVVPSVWEKLPGLETYRGKAWFCKRLAVAPGRFLRIVFGGVSHTGRVFADGRLLGSHHHAYSEWSVLLPPGKKNSMELVVEVDNTYGPASALHRPENDFYTYGGIIRPVEAQTISGVFIERMETTPVRRGRNWSLEVMVYLKNPGKEPARRDLVLSVLGKALKQTDIPVGALGAKKVLFVFRGLRPAEWSPTSPVLYPVKAVLMECGRVIDDLIDRTGFREIRIRGRGIYLNGERLSLRGYNRHEDHGAFGCALPVETMASDLSLLEDLGCNCVRTSHYQNDSRFLDLCDERGFLVWEESLAWQTPFSHPDFLTQTLACTREMLEQHRNHPSIILWGALNECDTKTARGRSVHARVLGEIRRLDPSRPVTYAGNHGKGDTCLRYCDVVSWNRYDAWYHGGVERIRPELESMLKWLDSGQSRGGAGKPVLLSEFGAAGLYGNRQATRQRWSEEYQAEVLDESLRVYLNHPRLSGALVWQFADCRVNEGSWPNRPRCHNNKGTLDEYRRPKDCYDVVRKSMRNQGEK